MSDVINTFTVISFHCSHKIIFIHYYNLRQKESKDIGRDVRPTSSC